MVESGKSMALLPLAGATVDMKAGDRGQRLIKKIEDAGFNETQATAIAQKVDAGMKFAEARDAVVGEAVEQLKSVAPEQVADVAVEERSVIDQYLAEHDASKSVERSYRLPESG